MIQQIAKENEAVTPISREMEGLKEYFPQCFNAQGEFDIDKFREAIQPQVDVTRVRIRTARTSISVVTTSMPCTISPRAMQVR